MDSRAKEPNKNSGESVEKPADGPTTKKKTSSQPLIDDRLIKASESNKKYKKAHYMDERDSDGMDVLFEGSQNFGNDSGPTIIFDKNMDVHRDFNKNFGDLFDDDDLA